MVKFSFIAFVLFLLISCSNDFPPAPAMEFCKFTMGGETKCESIHIFPKRDCEKIGGEIVTTCNENNEGEDEGGEEETD